MIFQAAAALMYDAVFVLVEAFNKFTKKKSDRSNQRRPGISSSIQAMNATRIVNCYPQENWVTPWEHGDKISKLLRKVSRSKLLIICV